MSDENNGTPTRRSSAEPTATGGPKPKRPPMPKKTKIEVLVVIGLIAAVPIIYEIITAGGIYQLSTSINPTGYYALDIQNVDELAADQLTFNVEIVSADNQLIATLPVTNGLFDTNTNVSATLQSLNQSYACVVEDGLKSFCEPIECSQSQSSPQMNDIIIRPRAVNSQMVCDIQISPATTGSYDYTDLLTNDVPSSYSVTSGSQYSLYVQIQNNAVVGESDQVGEMVILPNYILANVPAFADTWAINVTNYDGHEILFNNTLMNFTTSDPTGTLDLSYFSWEGSNYTMVTLPCVGSGTQYSDTFNFVCNQTGLLGYVLFDGPVDVAFDASWAYYKIGDFS